MFRIFSLLLFLSLLSMSGFTEPVQAQQSQRLKWENLLPDLAPLQNPLDALPADLWDAYNDIIYWKRLQEGPLDQVARDELKDVEKRLKKPLAFFNPRAWMYQIYLRDRKTIRMKLRKGARLSFVSMTV